MDNDSLIATAEVSMEYAALKNEDHCPKGMYVIPSAESVLIWDAVLFVHQGQTTHNRFNFSRVLLTTPTEGYYADSILKFRIQFPSDYPSRAPSVTFITDIFHPLISQKDGSLNLSVRFPHWRCVRGRLFSLHDNHLIVHNRPKQDHIFHVLHWIKVVFKKQTLDNLNKADCLNKEAFK